jgi:hypothetical protein
LFDPSGRPLFNLPGANRRWRCQFRYRGSRHESAVAQLFSLGIIHTTNNTHHENKKHIQFNHLLLSVPYRKRRMGSGFDDARAIQ